MRRLTLAEYAERLRQTEKTVENLRNELRLMAIIVQQNMRDIERMKENEKI